jgi:hypothetical protein
MQGTMPEIQWKIDFGHIITIVALIIAGAIAWGTMSNKLDQYQQAVTEIRLDVKEMHSKIDDVRTQQIRTETQLEVRQEEEGHKK